MKRPLRTALLALLGLLAAACARHTIIPDETLAMIFRDAFLSNAYISEERIPTDSLRIYEPIFARYGYTTDDVHYTIGNFSKRKSARLSDVVERAIDLLEAEGRSITAGWPSSIRSTTWPAGPSRAPCSPIRCFVSARCAIRRG